MTTLLMLLFACAPEVVQTPACDRFVACQSARDAASGTPTDVARFAADGDCWGTPAGQELCDRACVNGLAFLRESYPNLPTECAE